MAILSVFITLICCIILSVVVIRRANQKPLRDFKKLSSQLNLNIALSEQVSFWEVPKPALVGDYDKRYIQINVEERDKNGNILTQFLMTCANEEINFTIKKKPWLERNLYSYNYKELQAKNSLLTGDKVFDKYFVILSSEKKRIIRSLFNQSIRQYLLNNYDNITNNIVVKDFEIFTINNDLLNFKTPNSNQQKIVQKELKFLAGLARLIEEKIKYIKQPPQVKAVQLNNKSNFEWGWRG